MSTTESTAADDLATVEVPNGPLGTATLTLRFTGHRFSWDTGEPVAEVYIVVSGSTSNGFWMPGDRYEHLLVQAAA